MSGQPVSFTVRRPTPVSRASSGAESDSSFKVPSLPHHRVSHLNDSVPGSPLSQSLTSSPAPEPCSDSDDDEDEKDELVDAFDRLNGAQRCVHPLTLHLQPFQLTSELFNHSIRVNPRKRAAPQGPLVIPALKNKDWRALARKRRTAGQFLPPTAQVGADGSVGGLGTKDTINSGPVLQGIQLRRKEQVVQDEQQVAVEEDVTMETVIEETEDQKALRAILAGDTDGMEGPQIDIIPTPVSEQDAYKQDVDELPEQATLADYNRVPVSQFGAAMLRGMGWKEGQAASRKPGKGIVEPYLPEARPALLGIGAKEQEVYDDGSKKRKGPIRPEKRYVPVVKLAREGSEKRERSASPRRRGHDSSRSSRRGSPDRGYDDRRDGRSSESSRRDRDGRRDDRDRRDDRGRRDDRDRRDERDKRDDFDRSRDSSRKSRNY